MAKVSPHWPDWPLAKWPMTVAMARLLRKRSRGAESRLASVLLSPRTTAINRDSAMLRDDGCVVGAASRLVSPCILRLGQRALCLLLFVPLCFSFFFSFLFFFPFIGNVKPPGSFESLGINRRKREPGFRMHDVQRSITLIMRCEFVPKRSRADCDNSCACILDAPTIKDRNLYYD